LTTDAFNSAAHEAAEAASYAAAVAPTSPTRQRRHRRSLTELDSEPITAPAARSYDDRTPTQSSFRRAPVQTLITSSYVDCPQNAESARSGTIFNGDDDTTPTAATFRQAPRHTRRSRPPIPTPGEVAQNHIASEDWCQGRRRSRSVLRLTPEVSSSPQNPKTESHPSRYRRSRSAFRTVDEEASVNQSDDIEAVVRRRHRRHLSSRPRVPRLSSDADSSAVYGRPTPSVGLSSYYPWNPRDSQPYYPPFEPAQSSYGDYPTSSGRESNTDSEDPFYDDDKTPTNSPTRKTAAASSEAGSSSTESSATRSFVESSGTGSSATEPFESPFAGYFAQPFDPSAASSAIEPSDSSSGSFAIESPQSSVAGSPTAEPSDIDLPTIERPLTAFRRPANLTDSDSSTVEQPLTAFRRSANQTFEEALQLARDARSAQLNPRALTVLVPDLHPPLCPRKSLAELTEPLEKLYFTPTTRSCKGLTKGFESVDSCLAICTSRPDKNLARVVSKEQLK
jgi:hypothetical protein